jgi:DNA-binding Xre family transcriptional regulator
MPKLSPKTKTETQAILKAAKALLRKQKHTYEDLARHLEISLPSVKRAMNSSHLPLSRVLEICEFLGFSLAELLAFTRKDWNESFCFTPAQEDFFAEHPHFLAYFLEVLDLSPAEIEKRHGLSRKSTHAYLKKLEKMGLVEWHPGDKVKHQVHGPIHWDDHGRLGQKFSRTMIQGFASHAVKKLGAPEKMQLELQGFNLTEEEFSEFGARYGKLLDEFRQLSMFNRKIRKKTEAPLASVMMIADYWENPFALQVKEIAPLTHLVGQSAGKGQKLPAKQISRYALAHGRLRPKTALPPGESPRS